MMEQPGTHSGIFLLIFFLSFFHNILEIKKSGTPPGTIIDGPYGSSWDPTTNYNFRIPRFGTFQEIKVENFALTCLYLCGWEIQSQIKIVAKYNDPTELFSDDLQSPADLNI